MARFGCRDKDLVAEAIQALGAVKESDEAGWPVF